MNRRTFLRCMTVMGGAVVSKAFPAAVGGSEVIEIQRSSVAGFQFGEGEEVWDRLSTGALVTLVREPGNPYDERAVRVEWKGRKLGYVPRRENAAVCHLMDSGRVLDGKIIHLAESDDPWGRVRFSVGMVR